MRSPAFISGPLLALLVSLYALLTITPIPGQAEDPAGKADELRKQINDLEGAGQFDESAALAKELLELVRSSPDSKPYEIADAEWSVKTDEFAAGLPEEELEKLIEAHRLQKEASVAMGEDQFESCEEKLRRQLEILSGIYGKEHPEVASVMHNLAEIHRVRGDFEGAELQHRESMAILRKLFGPEHPMVAGIAGDLSIVLQKRGKYADAEKLAQEALATRLRLYREAHPDVANSYTALGLLFQIRGDYGGAEQYLSKALKILRELHGEEHPNIAAALNNYGLFQLARGDYGNAEIHLRESLVMKRKLFGDEHTEVAFALNNLGGLLRLRGDYATAESLIREALILRRRLLGKEHPLVASTLNNLANVYKDRGDWAAADPLYRESLALRRKVYGEENASITVALNNLANGLRGQGEYAAAEPLFRESLAMRRKLLGEEHPAVANALNNLGLLLNDRGDHEEAEQQIREALVMRQKLLGKRHPDTAASLQCLALLHRDRGDYSEAESLFRESLDIQRSRLGDMHPAVAKGLINLAMQDRALGRLAEAESLLVEAGNIYELARVRSGSGLDRATFGKSPYRLLAVTKLDLGKPVEAWPAVERELGRALSDLLLTADKRSLTVEESVHEDSLRFLLGDLERQLEAYRKEAERDSTVEAARLVEETRNRLFEAEASWSAFQQEIAVEYPISEGQVYPLERVQNSLGSGTAILGWLDVKMINGKYDSWGYVIRNNGPVQWSRLAAVNSPRELTRFYRDNLATAGSLLPIVNQDAHTLWLQRIEPLKSALEGVEELVVLASGPMLGIPVETFTDEEGRLLGERFAVSYAPSATIHTWLAEKESKATLPARRSALLVGDPPFNEDQRVSMLRETETVESVDVAAGGLLEATLLRSALAGNAEALGELPRLPGSRRETEAIAAISKGATLLLGPEASEQALVRLAEMGALRDYTAIHFATHALVDDTHPDRSALVLSQVDLQDPFEAALAGERIYDGLLPAKEIVREWELNADLVTLSACETGLGKEVGGEGYIGFAHAFLQAGARSLLVSLWKVEDEATALLMRRFYENRWGRYEDGRAGKTGEPMSKTTALQEVKQWLREYLDETGKQPYHHPYYWSAFILIGDPN